MTQTFSVIVAADQARGIGRAGDLPWRLPGDMAYYKRTTSTAPEGKQNAVIMGRKTFESIPPKFRPLRGRINVVLSRDPAYSSEGVLHAQALDQALGALERRADVAQLFVVGGAELYREALLEPGCTQVLITRVHARFECDSFLAPFEHDFALTGQDGPHREPSNEQAPSYTFETYTRRA